jgi:hypothetical protein
MASLPAVAAATATTGNSGIPADLSTTYQQEEDDEIPWGLIGLFGLAGLLGLKRRDNHVHGDPRARNRM